MIAVNFEKRISKKQWPFLKIEKGITQMPFSGRAKRERHGKAVPAAKEKTVLS
jgi:hypothetical protein